MRQSGFRGIALGAVFGVAASAQFLEPPSDTFAGYIDLPGRGIIGAGWFEESGNAIYDGDIIFGSYAAFEAIILNITYCSNDDYEYRPEQHSYSGRSTGPQGVVPRSNSIFPNSDSRWPNGTIRYRYANDTTESTLKGLVDPAIAAWSSEVPCTRWNKEANGVGDGLPGIVTISLGMSCSATVGAPPGNQLSMTLSVDCGLGTTMHEWGHVLGLTHEHKRPDRDHFIKFNCENAASYPPAGEANPAACCEPGACCNYELCQFTTDAGTYFNQDGPDAPGGAYDVQSIMHYPSWAFAKPGTETLSGGPKDIPSVLTEGDIARVRQLYGCFEVDQPDTPDEPDTPPTPEPECPSACEPLENTCSPTALNCIYPSLDVLRSDPSLTLRGACACRAGYKADNVADDDTTKQWRLPADEGNFRVWVAQGVECNTLCTVSTGSEPCGEVKELPAQCLVV